MRKWTIYQIRQKNHETGHFFFSKNSMRFFKETISDYGVWHRKDWEGKDRIFIHNKKNGKVREFNPETGEISRTLSAEQIVKAGLLRKII